MELLPYAHQDSEYNDAINEPTRWCWRDSWCCLLRVFAHVFGFSNYRWGLRLVQTFGSSQQPNGNVSNNEYDKKDNTMPIAEPKAAGREEDLPAMIDDKIMPIHQSPSFKKIRIPRR